MPRPSKSAELLASCSQTKEEIRIRKEQENRLKGGENRINPPTYLSKEQKKIFRNIVSELKASGILGNLDVYILAQCSIAIDRLQTIEAKINAAPILLRDTKLISSRDKYAKDFYRCCNELSLSPQSRAKMANINLQQKQEQEDPLLKVLRGGKP